MRRVLGVDPGPSKSAWVIYDAQAHDVIDHDYADNDQVVADVATIADVGRADHLAIEMVTSYGMSVKDDVFESAVMVGRCIEVWSSHPDHYTRVYRRKPNHEADVPGVVQNLNRSAAGNDTTVRAALIDRFGGEEKAIGAIKCGKCKGRGWFGRGRPTCPECEGGGWDCPPGPLYGISGDEWAALAVSITFAEARRVTAA